MPRKKSATATQDLIEDDAAIGSFEEESLIEIDSPTAFIVESDIISSAASRRNSDADSDGAGDGVETVSPLSDDSVKMYLREIGRVSLLNAKQEIELARAIKEGDITAKRKLVRHNLRLVVSIAKNISTEDYLFLI